MGKKGSVRACKRSQGALESAVMLLSLPRWPHHVLLAGALAGVPVIAAAQTQPMPELPQPPSGRPGETAPEETAPTDETALPEEVALPQAAGSPTVGRSRVWDYSLVGGLGWESNVGPELSSGPSDLVGQLRGRITRIVNRPRSSVQFSGAGTGYLYRQQTNWNRADLSLDLDASRTFLPRTTGTISLGFSYDHSDTSSVLADQGVLLPLTRTVNYSAGAEATHRLSRRTGIRGRIDVGRLDLPESDIYQGTSSLRMTVALDQRLGTRETVSVVLSSESTGGDQTDDASRHRTRYLSLQWQRLLSPYTAVLVEGGPSYTADYARAGLDQQWGFFGGVSVRRAVRRSRLTAFYRREVIPAFEFGGLRYVDRFGLNAATPLRQAWWLTLASAYTQDAGSDEYDGRQSRIDASFTLDKVISPRLRLLAEGRYSRQAAYGLVPELDAFQAGVYVEFVPSTDRRR